MKTKQWISHLMDHHPRNFGYAMNSSRLKDLTILNQEKEKTCTFLMEVIRGHQLGICGVKLLPDLLEKDGITVLYSGTNHAEVRLLIDDIYSRFAIYGEGTANNKPFSEVIADLLSQSVDYEKQKSIILGGLSQFVFDEQNSVSVIGSQTMPLFSPSSFYPETPALEAPKKPARFAIKIQDYGKIPVLDLLLVPEGKKGQSLKPVPATRPNLLKYDVLYKNQVPLQWYQDFQNYCIGIPERQRAPILKLIAPFFQKLLSLPDIRFFIPDTGFESKVLLEVEPKNREIKDWELRFYKVGPVTYKSVLVELGVENPVMYSSSRLVPFPETSILAVNFLGREWSYQMVPYCEGLLDLAEVLSNQSLLEHHIKVFLAAIQNKPIPWLRINPKIHTQKQVIYRPRPRIVMHDYALSRSAVMMDLDFMVPDSAYEHASSKDGEPTIMQQEPGFVKTIMALMANSPIGENAIFIQDKLRFSLGIKQFQDWLTTEAPKLLDAGFEIYSHKERHCITRPKNVSVKLRVYSRDQWLEFKPEFLDSDGKMEAFLEVLPGRFEVFDSKGRLIHLQPKDLKRLSNLIESAKEDNGVFRLPARNGLLALSVLEEEDLHELPEAPQITRFSKLLEGISEPKFKEIKNFKASLRPYQMEGFSRLLFWHQEEFCGVLADDMGLGKTVQTLALLQFLKNRKQLKKTLLILPLSALSNWKSEIAKFTDLSCEFFHGASSDLKDIKADLILSTYGTARQRNKEICEYIWDYLILDESQNIKNLNALTTKAIKQIPSEHRLALSGTPLENHLLELFSLFDFLMPGYLGNTRWFKEHIATPIEKQDLESRKKLLKTLISPFMLRRTKKEVLTDLPPKIETDHLLTFNKDQEEAYAITARSFREALDTYLVEDRFSQTPQTLVLEALLRLRQICIAPVLADPRFKNTSSAKLEYLADTLPQLLEEGHKVLVFSQFPSALNQLEKALEEFSLPILRLDGTHTQKQRDLAVNSFQCSLEPALFLLSIKAGGTALNLTEADYVFIMDPWWNPFVERQATDRAHRIGQKNTVHVYRLLTSGTVEERIREMQKNKQSLFEDFAEGGSNMLASLTLNDIRYLLD
ncbi:MAG: DEAD/DEAH box helicase [Candidatus Cloacimonetes bacterium]|nr:DEAD/DEAH box helicase [Candidatus Cloacimonadota bacterium]